MDRMKFSEGVAECIANAIWHECDDYLHCKTNDLEEAAAIIIKRLEQCGFLICQDNKK